MIRAGNEGNPKILVVDDEEEVLWSLADLLRKDFFIHGTTDVDEALESIATREFSVVISDQRMPTKTGVELLSRGAGMSPDTVRILLTAYSDIEAVIQAVNSGHIYHYVTKPWDPEKLLGMLKEAARQQMLVAERTRG
jgi:DNA-binding NtrC family response regulator